MLDRNANKTMNAAAILATHKGKKKKSDFTYEQVHDAAAELGAQGGLVGGPARAEALSKRERREIAVHAANARWGNRCNCSYCK